MTVEELEAMEYGANWPPLADYALVLKLIAAHTRITKTKNIWYNPRWKEADKRICVMASDLRCGVSQPRKWPRPKEAVCS